MSKAPDNASGAETCLRCGRDLLHMPDNGYYCCCGKRRLTARTIASGDGMERFSVSERYDPFDDESYGVMLRAFSGEYVMYSDASRLLAQKDAELQRLSEALTRLTDYAECQVAAFRSGRPSLDMTMFPALCKNAREALNF